MSKDKEVERLSDLQLIRLAFGSAAMVKALPTEERKEEPLFLGTFPKHKLNYARLREILEGEGRTLLDVRDIHTPGLLQFYKKDPKTVLFVPPEIGSQMKSAAGECVDISDSMGALQFDETRMFALESGMTKQLLLTYIYDCNDCLVCFEETLGYTLKSNRVVCKCGALLCLGCHIDLLLTSTSETQMGYHCPNCRSHLSKYNGWFQLIHSLLTSEETSKISLEGMGDTRLDFICEVTGLDLRRVSTASEISEPLTQMVAHITASSKSRAFQGEMDFGKLFKNASKHVRIAQRRAVASLSLASASASGSVVGLSTGGCANCGKSFWDKCERKRAPKCGKCKRTVYCTAKCRKKHAKTHASECVAVAPKKKRKKKKKKTKKHTKTGCTPY